MPLPHTPAVLSTLILLVVVPACGGGGDTPVTSASTTSSGAGGSGGASSGPGGGGASGPLCPAPEPAHDGATAVDMSSVTAVLVDQDDQPAAGANCTICGTNICSEVVASAANGAVTIAAPNAPMDHPRFNIGYVGEGFAKLTSTIPMSPSYDFGTVRAVRLPLFAQGAAFVPGQDAGNSGVSLAVPADASLEFELDFVDPAKQRFVAAVVDITGFAPSELPAVPPSLGVEVLVASGPYGTHICPGAKLTFPNVAAWAAGSEVELYLNGNLTFSHYAPYGGWALVAEGSVSQDGMTVSTSDATAIELLGVWGVKPK